MPARALDHLEDQQALRDLAEVLVKMEPLERARFIRGLLPQQRRVVERAVAYRFQAGWRADPLSMAQHLQGVEERKPWAYVKLLSRKFVEAFTGVDPRQLWSMPSQYGKTTNLVTDGVPWALSMNPRLRIMYVSYDADKAVEEGGKARDLIQANESELGIKLKADRKARGMWRTEAGGGLYCVGVHGGIVGWPADAMLGDDLVAGWQKAHSETERDAVWAVYTSQMRLRLQHRSNPVILAGTRWHMDDPIGRVLEGRTGEDWTYVRLPARAEPYDPSSMDPLLHTPDPLGRAVGEVIEPERFDDAEVQARAQGLGSYLAAGLEQQRPAPEEGNDIKRAWFQLVSSLPPTYSDALTSWDMKLKDKESGDFVVGQVWARLAAELYVLDEFRGQWDQATVANAIALSQVRYPWVRRHVVENTGNGPEVMAALRKAEPAYEVTADMAAKLGMTETERQGVEALRRRGLMGLLPENPKGDKRVRMRAQVPIVEAGHVHILATASWLPGYLEEMAAFPNGTYDDRVDATSQALKRLAQGGAMFETPPTQSTPAGPLPSPAMPRRPAVAGMTVPGRRRGLSHPLPD